MLIANYSASGPWFQEKANELWHKLILFTSLIFYIRKLCYMKGWHQSWFPSCQWNRHTRFYDSAKIYISMVWRTRDWPVKLDSITVKFWYFITLMWQSLPKLLPSSPLNTKRVGKYKWEIQSNKNDNWSSIIYFWMLQPFLSFWCISSCDRHKL